MRSLIEKKMSDIVLLIYIDKDNINIILHVEIVYVQKFFTEKKWQ